MTVNYWSLRVSNDTTIVGNADVTSLELPTITRTFDTDRRIGYSGIVPIPTGFDELSLTFTTKAIDNVFLTVLSSIDTVNFVFTGLEQDTTSGVNKVTVLCSGFVENLPMGTFSDGGSEYEFTAKISRIELIYNGDSVLVFDPKNYIYSINGLNQFSTISSTLLG